MRLVSYSQNGEDVLLWRALGQVQDGFYIDVGANDPEENSVSRVFYDAGWHGINIEPMPSYYDVLLRERPRDINLAVACGPADGSITLFDTPTINGWASTDAQTAAAHRAEGVAIVELQVQMRTLAGICAEYAPANIHFLKIDVEGFEAEVLAGMDLQRWRPWILVIEATVPGKSETNHEQWESMVTQHDYQFAYFDGLNRYYVSAEHADLLPALSVQPNVFDDFIVHHFAHALHRVHQLDTELNLARQALAIWEERQATWLTQQEAWATQQEGWTARQEGWAKEQQGWAKEQESWTSEQEGWTKKQEGWAKEQEGWAKEQEGWAKEREVWAMTQQGWEAEKAVWAAEQTVWAAKQTAWETQQDLWKAHLADFDAQRVLWKEQKATLVKQQASALLKVETDLEQTYAAQGAWARGLEAHILAMEATWWWRLTEPLRMLPPPPELRLRDRARRAVVSLAQRPAIRRVAFTVLRRMPGVEARFLNWYASVRGKPEAVIPMAVVVVVPPALAHLPQSARRVLADLERSSSLSDS